MTFNELGVSNEIADALKKQNINMPSKVQSEAFKTLFEGNDCIMESPTGSGKTLAFVLPVIDRIVKNNIEGNYAIILVPTHELAVQIKKQVDFISDNISYNIESSLIIGDVNINRQIEALRVKPQIIIGTAGRIYELIKKKKIAAHLVKYLVIDEADKLCDNNNYDATFAVRKCLMKDAQIVLSSASITPKTREVSINILCQPKEISVKNDNNLAGEITHIYVVENRDKIEMIRKVLKNLKPKKSLVFINKVYDIELATSKLKYNNLKAECIHGSNDKTDRKKLMDDYRSGKLNILISTDLAARGLHVDGIDMVINVSMPENPTDYLHRAGRCGRNGNKGTSISIITEKEKKLIDKYSKELGIKFTEKKFFNGKLYGDNNNKKRTDKPNGKSTTDKSIKSKTTNKKPISKKNS